jgi:hypothetical protein
MSRICDLFEVTPLNSRESLNSASMDFIRATMQATMSASDSARVLISKIISPGEVVIQVAFARDSIREPRHEMGRKRAIEILRAVSTGAMAIIEGDFTVSASRWLGAPGAMYKVSEILFKYAYCRGSCDLTTSNRLI